MENESTIDSNQVQRLVDGELSADEIRTLFETADQNPEQWRGIACAFAEDQLFARQFDTLTEQIDPPKPVTPVVRQSKPSPQPSPPAMPLVKRLAIAASLAAVGLFGYLIGNDGPMTTPGELASTENMIADNHPNGAVESLTPVNLQPEYRMELLTPDGESIDGEVDLYRYNDLHQLVQREGGNRNVKLSDFLPPSGFSTEARQRLSQSGYEINESTNYVSGRLQDGRQFVVPVRSIRFDQGH